MATIDAVLIPGGGVSAAGEVVPWVKVRLERAIAYSPSPTYFIPLSAGTTHKPPPLDTQGFPVLESIAAARYLLSRGVEAERILPETVSLDTIGNAYFARVQHTDPLGLRRLHIITSQFHWPRTQAIFTWIFGLPGSAVSYELTFEATPDIGIPAAVLTARYQKEQAGLAHVMALRSRLNSLPDLHRWLYTDHDAYAIARQPTRQTGIALDTY
ncbi:MAG: YdcF family protein [Leptolyngbya sp. SIO1D8]|nr:YdcF family protein [Leptolyngbya sp. SIO1D8]